MQDLVDLLEYAEENGLNNHSDWLEALRIMPGWAIRMHSREDTPHSGKEQAACLVR